MAPATAMTWQPRGLFSPCPNRRSLIRPKAPSRSSIRTGWVRNSLAPARSACRIKLPSFDELTTSTAQSGESGGQLAHQIQAFCGSASMATRPMSGLVWATTSAKNS